MKTTFPLRQKIRDYSRFSEAEFHFELSQIERDSIITDNHNDIDRTFSRFFNTLNKLDDKHATLNRYLNDKQIVSLNPG